MNELDEFYSLVANVGFPIAVAGYLLLRMEAKMDNLTAAVTALKESIQQKNLGVV